jgi:hypothetical protein
MSRNARACHFCLSADVRSKATLGSQEWFTGHYQFSSVTTHGNKKRARGRGQPNELTVNEIGIQLEVVLLSGAPLHGGVYPRGCQGCLIEEGDDLVTPERLEGNGDPRDGSTR